MERSKDTFFESISTQDPKTVLAYQKRIKYFEDWLSGKNYQLSDLKDSWQDILQLYVNFLSKKNHPRTVQNYVSSLRVYLYYLGYKITKDDFKELRFPKIQERELHPLQLDEIIRIFEVLPYKQQAFHLCQLSGGFRVGELCQLRKRDLIFNDRITVKIPSSIAKFKKARTTIISKECAIKLTPILKRINDDDLIFGYNKDVHLAEKAVEQTLRNALKKTGLDQKYDERNYKINTHSFRAYFITKVSRYNDNLAKKMSGQKGYLLTYDRLSNEELLNEYLKFESELLIYDQTKKDLKIKELEATVKENSDLKTRLEKIEEHLFNDQLELLKYKAEKLRESDINKN